MRAPRPPGRASQGGIGLPEPTKRAIRARLAEPQGERGYLSLYAPDGQLTWGFRQGDGGASGSALEDNRGENYQYGNDGSVSKFSMLYPTRTRPLTTTKTAMPTRATSRAAAERAAT